MKKEEDDSQKCWQRMEMDAEGKQFTELSDESQRIEVDAEPKSLRTELSSEPKFIRSELGVGPQLVELPSPS